MGLMISACLPHSEQPSGLTPTPPYSGEPFPRPPHQDDPWTPPETALPTFLIDATATLFEQGLADPRGCSYREIRLATPGDRPNVPDSRRPGLLHGWVLPAEDDDRPRFAVCWNGLVYPLAAIGAPADLEADIQALLASEAQARADRKGDRLQRLLSGFAPPRAWDHARAASHQSAMALKVCLLLRLDRPDLAEPLWAVGTDWTPDRLQPDLASYGVSYLTLASDWTWVLFDRALTAHAEGDDPLALASTRLLADLQPAIEAHAAAMGFARPRHLEGGERPYLEFLAQVPELLADQERRAREPRRTPALEVGLDRFPDQAERIAALIRDLEDVRPSPMIVTSLGGVSLAGSPIVQALIQEGDAAVEPLLDCLEHDDRLTRSYDMGRGFTRYRRIVPVSQAAYVVITSILQTREFGQGIRSHALIYEGKSGRQRLAAAIRAYRERRDDPAPDGR